MVWWTPQPGPQAAAATCPADLTLFGGTRGGGKSDCLIGRHVAGAEKYQNAWNGLIVRRKYKEFAELRRRWDELIQAGLPAERIGGDQQTNYIRFDNGATIQMPAIQRPEQLNDYVGHQYTEISPDEGTTFPFFTKLIDKLKGSLRSPHGVPCHFFVTGNPGGPGHNEVKMMFVSPAQAGKVFYNSEGESIVFIKSFLKDNKILCDNDPRYVKRLRSIKDESLRRAWLEGDWDVYIGQAFEFLPQTHVIKPIQIPYGAPLYMTFDWGYGAPFSIGWWWVDNDGRVYRFMEWYGWNGTPNQGLRLTDNEIAKGIIEREKTAGIWGKTITRKAGPDCFSKKPDYKGGGQGPSTADEFYEVSTNLVLTPGDPSRELKIRQFRERLLIPRDKEGKQTGLPMMMIYSTCKDFIRTIPALCTGEAKPEDIDTDQEDHIYDEACHIAMARPLSREFTFLPSQPAQQEYIENDPMRGYYKESYGTREQEYVPLDKDVGM